MPWAEWLLHIGACSSQQVVLLPCVDWSWIPYSRATWEKPWQAVGLHMHGLHAQLDVGWHYVSMTMDLSVLCFGHMDGDDVVSWIVQSQEMVLAMGPVLLICVGQKQPANKCWVVHVLTKRHGPLDGFASLESRHCTSGCSVLLVCRKQSWRHASGWGLLAVTKLLWSWGLKPSAWTGTCMWTSWV